MIPRGTPSGGSSGAGRGVPHLERRSRGDLIVRARVQVPTTSPPSKRSCSASSRRSAVTTSPQQTPASSRASARRSGRSVHPADEPGPLVFVDDLAVPELAGDDRHHSRPSRLALRPVVLATVPAWRTAILGDELEPTGAIVEPSRRPTPALTVGFALVKGDKPELIVQKLTELGIDRIVPFRGALRRAVGRDKAEATACAPKAVAPAPTVAVPPTLRRHRRGARSRRPLRPGVPRWPTTTAGPEPSPPGVAGRTRGSGAPEEGEAAAGRTPGLARGARAARGDRAVAVGALLAGLRAGVVGRVS